MKDQAPRPIPFSILIVGLTLAVGIAMWSGRQYLLHGGGIGYGIAGGISLGAAYAFIKQIKIRFSSKSGDTE
ncbi:hypothetical protein [Herminiimonas fonticola]|uniref:Uncharacterized protein n=1 Tax=Herminiimonas fonticola TaxID=303380 RepID=A0A4R6G822_9BURK|nr:hypothetical protein [Herminiimonas fonticola]RBA23925.1 hypothetical protein Hfont_1737 [Herminiimonas fonticola]TDN89925.1 hypothetical protein EV677_1993 [Herminiimonas fonticola]